MQRFCASAMALLWLCTQPLALCAGDGRGDIRFQSAQAASVEDITKPNFSIANGTVVLDVLVSEKGDVRSVQVRRDIVSLTEVAVASVRTWKFEPAQLRGTAVTSRITVAVTFNPASTLAENIPLPPLLPQNDEVRIRLGFQPVEVTFAAFPRYPDTAINPGTVIIQATIDEAGILNSPKVLRDAPPFTDKALRALGDWKFSPAILSGGPVKSKVILAFVFRVPIPPLALP